MDASLTVVAESLRPQQFTQRLSALLIRLLPGDLCASTIRHMARTEYYHDVTAPQAQGLLLAAFAIVRNHLGQILLVRRTDDGYWELPGGRVEVGETASRAAVREVAEESGVSIKITRLAGIYSDPAHVLAYPHEKSIYQQCAVCFHATTPARDAHPDGVETSAAAWFNSCHTTPLAMHPAMRQRLTNALNKPRHAHFD